jgi:RNase adaptor protein for sRNA GlmZ degradation
MAGLPATTLTATPPTHPVPRRRALAWPAAVVVTSFGYLHGPAPYADITLDVRTHLRDPHLDPCVRELTGRDGVVRARVLATPGARGLIEGITTATKALLLGPGSAPECHLVRVAIGCAGGRHRSVVLADHIAARLALAGWEATTTHLDIHRPVVTRQPPTHTRQDWT